MKAAWYDRQGEAPRVLEIGELPDPDAGPGEIRIRVSASGINPGDVKKRQDTFGVGMPFPRIIPHSDGAGVIDRVGSGVPQSRIGERVWCFGAQSYRPWGTAAEYVVVPSDQAVFLPEQVSFEQGACLGIAGITAHRAVHVAGPVADCRVLVQGGAGAVGMAAVAIARHAEARVIATVRSAAQEQVALGAGAHAVVRMDSREQSAVASEIREAAGGPIDHIVEVAFHANARLDEELLDQGGSIATYATNAPDAPIPFWPLVFKNVGVFFLGSDDFPAEAKAMAARDLIEALSAGWTGFPIGQIVELGEIARAHESVESRSVDGRVVLRIDPID